MFTNLTQATTAGVLTFLGVSAGNVIDEQTTVRIGSAVAVAIFVATMSWKLSSRLTHVTDSIEKLEKTVEGLACQTSKCDAVTPKEHRK